jgi:hypothetical protein
MEKNLNLGLGVASQCVAHTYILKYYMGQKL